MQTQTSNEQFKGFLAGADQSWEWAQNEYELYCSQIEEFLYWKNLTKYTLKMYKNML